MNLFARHKNTVVLATVLLAQFLALAVQVKRQTAEGPVRVIRLLAVSTLAPFERLLIYSGGNMRRAWANYIDLRSVRSENARLRFESEQMRLERQREQEDARQARRIQALLGFKEQWIDATVAAQVIGTSGTESSRLLYLDKGAKNGIRADMPVITPDGVVGKVLTVYGETAQVLMINDPTSGVGATLVNSRLQGIVKGTATGEVQLNYIMGDEAVQSGEALVTSGGDRVFPKGLPLGTVGKVAMGRNLFLDITLKPAVDLNRLEEVLVVTEQKPRAPDTAGLGPIRAADILAQHLPGVPLTPPPGVQTLPVQAAPAASIPPPSAQKTLTPKSQMMVPPGTNAAKQPVKPAVNTPPHTAAPKTLPTRPSTVVPSGTTTTKPTVKPVASTTHGPTPKTPPAKLQTVVPGTKVPKPVKPVEGAAPDGVAPKTPTTKLQTVVPSGPSGAKPTVKAAGTAGASTAVQKSSGPKPVAPKASTANGDRPKPRPISSDKYKPGEGTPPQ